MGLWASAWPKTQIYIYIYFESISSKGRYFLKTIRGIKTRLVGINTKINFVKFEVRVKFIFFLKFTLENL